MSEHASPLIVAADDEAAILLLLERKIELWGFRFEGAVNREQLLMILDREQPTLLILDLQFGSNNGIDMLGELREKYPNVKIVLLTGHATVADTVAAIKQGAYDFLPKPADWDRLELMVRHAIEQQRLRERIETLEEAVEIVGANRPLLGKSAAIRRVIQIIDTVAPTDAPILVQGESGTGKELVARALHQRSQRSQRPFIAVNMAAMPATLVESTLFGHERGAFTGADKVRIGCFEMANQGTLFLDEIGEMDLSIQSKLLRVLQEHSFERVGSSRTIASDCRIIAATNCDLGQRVRDKLFREDLYYRLNVVPIELPSLRQRPEDIAPLATRFLQRASQRYQRETPGFSASALNALATYDWPGNVRELENVVERLVIFAEPGCTIGVESLPANFRQGVAPMTATPVQPAREMSPKASVLDRFENIEREAIIDALAKSNGAIPLAAKYLGLGQATIYRKLKRYGIDRRGFVSNAG